jgi:hypothetical protein
MVKIEIISSPFVFRQALLKIAYIYSDLKNQQ